MSILAVGTLSQEDPKFEAKTSLNYVVGPCLKTKLNRRILLRRIAIYFDIVYSNWSENEKKHVLMYEIIPVLLFFYQPNIF